MHSLYIYMKYIYLYIDIQIYESKSFLTTLDKILRNNIKKKKRDGEIGKCKPNEMGAMNMKQKK